MASRHDRDMQDRRRRLRERQERERHEVRRRQQEQTAALRDLDSAVERLLAADAAVAAAVGHAVRVFPSVDALAELTSFDARELRAYARRHRRAGKEPQTSSPLSVADEVTLVPLVPASVSKVATQHVPVVDDSSVQGNSDGGG
jgi:hypothetical protein